MLSLNVYNKIMYTIYCDNKLLYGTTEYFVVVQLAIYYLYTGYTDYPNSYSP